MGLSVTTAPGVEPVSRDELKAHLRLDATDDDLGVVSSIAPGSHAVAAAYSLEGSTVEDLGFTSTVFFNAGTCGSSGTVDVKVQESSDGAAWSDVSSGAFTQVTEANDNTVYEKAYTGDLRYIRAVATVAVAACEFSVTVAREALTTEENDLLDSLITAARDDVETRTRRALVNTALKYTLDTFPCVIRLPRSPVVSVESLKYFDTDGVQQTLSAALYTLDTESEPARIVPAYSESWPSIRAVPNAVEVNFTAGYGAAATDVPRMLVVSIKILCGHWYEHREAVSETRLSEVPDSVERLIARYRVMEYE